MFIVFFFYISGLMHREFVPANKTVAAFYVHFEKFTWYMACAIWIVSGKELNPVSR